MKDFLRSIRAIGSAEDLPPRIRAETRGSARTPPGSARIRRPSAKKNFQRTPPDVRRTSGGHWRTPPVSARIRADSAANWRSCSLKKMSARKIFHNTIVRGGRTSAAEKLPPRTLPPRTLPPRTSPPRKNFRRGKTSAADISAAEKLPRCFCS